MAMARPNYISREDELLDNRLIDPNELLFVEGALRTGKATPLINLILGITKHNYDHLGRVIISLQKRVEQLESTFRHVGVGHAVQPPPPPPGGEKDGKLKLEPRKSWLDGTPVSEGENDDPWAGESQEEDNHKDIKF